MGTAAEQLDALLSVLEKHDVTATHIRLGELELHCVPRLSAGDVDAEAKAESAARERIMYLAAEG